MESRMMATVEPHYAFSVIDLPTIPEPQERAQTHAHLRAWERFWKHAGSDGVISAPNA